MSKNIPELDALVGNTYQYKGKNITIERYKKVGYTNTVIFAPGPINLLDGEVSEFIENLGELIEKKSFVPAPQPKKETQVVSFESTPENKAIKATLMETLEKVKADPSYIPQAKAISDVVKNLVDIQKNEIQFLNVMKKYN